MFSVSQTEAYRDWFDKLRDAKTKAAIDARIRRLSLGNKGDSKSVGAGVSELRVDIGPRFRIYFAQRAGRVVLLLCGGDKSSQKADIARAKRMAVQLLED
jgi:putative addiction module killer protein